MPVIRNFTKKCELETILHVIKMVFDDKDTTLYFCTASEIWKSFSLGLLFSIECWTLKHSQYKNDATQLKKFSALKLSPFFLSPCTRWRKKAANSKSSSFTTESRRSYIDCTLGLLVFKGRNHLEIVQHFFQRVIREPHWSILIKKSDQYPQKNHKSICHIGSLHCQQFFRVVNSEKWHNWYTHLIN